MFSTRRGREGLPSEASGHHDKIESLIYDPRATTSKRRSWRVEGEKKDDEGLVKY